MSSVTGSVADALSPNPPPHAFAWASLQAAVNCPGSFPNPTTAPQGLRTRAPCCALCLSGSLKDSEVKRGAGAGDWCAEKSGPSQLPEGPVGGGGLALQPWPARSPGPEGHSPPPPQPRSPGPAPPSLALPASQSLIASQSAEGVFLPGGQSVSGVFRRGLNTLSTSARPGSWTDTSVLSHATRRSTRPPPSGLPARPAPRPGGFLVTH